MGAVSHQVDERDGCGLSIRDQPAGFVGLYLLLLEESKVEVEALDGFRILPIRSCKISLEFGDAFFSRERVQPAAANSRIGWVQYVRRAYFACRGRVIGVKPEDPGTQLTRLRVAGVELDRGIDRRGRQPR